MIKFDEEVEELFEKVVPLEMKLAFKKARIRKKRKNREYKRKYYLKKKKLKMQKKD